MGECGEVCGEMGRVEKCGVGVEKCVGVWVRGDVGKCVVGAWGEMKGIVGGGVGGDVRKCWGRCGGVGKCVGVWGEVWKSVGENIKEVWESVLGCGEGKGEMWGEV